MINFPSLDKTALVNKKLQLGVLTFLVAALPVFVFLAGQEIRQRIKGAGNASLVLEPVGLVKDANGKYNFYKGQKVKVDLKLTSDDQKVEAADANFTYN